MMQKYGMICTGEMIYQMDKNFVPTGHEVAKEIVVISVDVVK